MEKETSDGATALQKLLYPKPKILLIDLGDSTEHVLKKAGYRIDVGTFGEAYGVDKSEYYEKITPTASLPNQAEQEIIVIDLIDPKIKKNFSGEKTGSRNRQ